MARCLRSGRAGEKLIAPRFRMPSATQTMTASKVSCAPLSSVTDALVSDVDADGVYSVHYVDKQGQLCTQRAGGLV